MPAILTTDPKITLLQVVDTALNGTLTADDNLTTLQKNLNYMLSTAWYQDKVTRKRQDGTSYDVIVPLQITVGPTATSPGKFISIGGGRILFKIRCPIDVWARDSIPGSTPKVTGKQVRWKAFSQIVAAVHKNQVRPANGDLVWMHVKDFIDLDDVVTRPPLFRTRITVELWWDQIVQ